LILDSALECAGFGVRRLDAALQRGFRVRRLDAALQRGGLSPVREAKESNVFFYRALMPT
jgi:hypothetical protein